MADGSQTGHTMDCYSQREGGTDRARTFHSPLDTSSEDPSVPWSDSKYEPSPRCCFMSPLPDLLRMKTKFRHTC